MFRRPYSVRAAATLTGKNRLQRIGLQHGNSPLIQRGSVGFIQTGLRPVGQGAEVLVQLGAIAR